MKDGKNKPTDNQKKWLAMFEAASWRVEICYSFDEAVAVLKDFLRIDE
jgi:hypothetical protein